MSLHLITLGPPRAFNEDAELIDLPSQRLRFALLVYLAVEGEASRESVLSVFWPDRAESRGRHALRQMLYELRQLLGEQWVELGRERIVVHADVDAAAFERAVADGDDAAALALYGGAFLQGFTLDNHAFDGWVDRRRAQLGRTHRRLRREQIDGLLAAGRTDAALRSAQQWVELDPLEDEASHALIRGLAASGQRLEALQFFERYERQLAAELQVEPLDETRALVEQIRAGEASSAAGSLPANQGQAPATGVPAASGPSASDTVQQSARPAPPPVLATSIPGPAGARGAPSRPDRRESSLRRLWSNPRWRHRLGFAAALLVLLSTVVLAYRADRPKVSGGVPSARVLVLPFTDQSDDSTLVSLATALTEALARNLAQSQPLDIVSPTGVALLRDRGVSDDSLRRLLQADYLVSGTVFSAPDSVRVAVELLDGRTGSLMRSELIERDRAESRILVDDVIARTAGFLRREVGQQVEVRRVRSSTASEEAWRSVLESRTSLEPLGRLIRYRDYAAVERAISRSDSLLARAAELDRKWAEPLVMRGWLMERRAFISAFAAAHDSASRRKLLEAGRSMADRALERDATEARAYELRGAMMHQLAILPGVPLDSAQKRFALGEEDLRRATDLDPQSPSSWRRLADLLNTAGRYAAAKSAAERAYAIDRYVAEANSIVNVLFSTSLELGEDSDAQRWCNEGRRAFPGQLPFVYCLFALHAWGEEIQPDVPLLRDELHRYRKGQAVQPELLARFEMLMAAAYVRAGEPDSARAILRRTATASDPGLLWMRAGVLGMLGDDAAALNALDLYMSRASWWDGHRVARTRPFWRFRGRPDYERLLAGPAGGPPG